MSVIAYLRVSTTDQTIENQRKQIADAGYQVGKGLEFVDEAISGSVLAADRPGLRTAISKAREGDIFVVTAIDRLGRNVVDVLNTANEIASTGARLVSLREGFDLSTIVGKMMLTMMAGFAEMERNLTAERRLAGIARARAEGVHMGRPKHPHEEEIRMMWADGLRYGEIVTALAGKGIKAGKTTIYSFRPN